MPFTPFHFGPNLWIGILLLKFINIGAFLLSNIIIDLEPLIVLIFKLEYPLHGYMHSYLIVTLLALPSTILYHRLLFIFNKILKPFKFAQESSKKTIFFSFLIGFYFHIFLDSIIYKDITPFWPFKFKPFFAISGSTTIYIFCIASFFVAVFFFLSIGRKNKFAKYFFRISSAIIFGVFIFYSYIFFSMGSFFESGFDDGPFFGLPFNGKIINQPSSTLKMNDKFFLESYNRTDKQPVLVLRDINKNIIWSRIITTDTEKSKSNTYVSKLILSEKRNNTVYGLAEWTYGNECITIILDYKYNLKYFYLSW